MVGNRPGIYASAAEVAVDWPLLRAGKKRIVFTNGCFDLLHAGHVLYLEEARALGDMLVLGLNQDDSIRRLKGATRPIVPFADRATVLTGLRAVDLVVGFFEDTPYDLIRALEPDMLVKGGDWQVADIVGSDLVMARGGTVRSLAFKPGSSTTNIVEKVLANHGQTH